MFNIIFCEKNIEKVIHWDWDCIYFDIQVYYLDIQAISTILCVLLVLDV